MENARILECCWEVCLAAHRPHIQCPTAWSLQPHWFCGPDFSQCADWYGVFYRPFPNHPPPGTQPPRSSAYVQDTSVQLGSAAVWVALFPTHYLPGFTSYHWERKDSREREITESNFLILFCLFVSSLSNIPNKLQPPPFPSDQHPHPSGLQHLSTP